MPGIKLSTTRLLALSMQSVPLALPTAQIVGHVRQAAAPVGSQLTKVVNNVVAIQSSATAIGNRVRAVLTRLS
jgi:hypothetical protein